MRGPSAHDATDRDARARRLGGSLRDLLRMAAVSNPRDLELPFRRSALGSRDVGHRIVLAITLSARMQSRNRVLSN